MSSETWADWCGTDDDRGIAICGTRMSEHGRKPLGERWCFHHRRRHDFYLVVMVPDGLSYYGPHAEIHGETTGCTDLFPGWSREWDE